ncbi:MAG: PSD1 domain-containing protein [Planctomycetes bacterium]|nr:PSD1 domain-containing protein [Planctomycetota bacterium]
MRPQRICMLFLLTFWLVNVSGVRAAEKKARSSRAANQIDFARDVQPLFAKHCFRCHGPKKQESNYRLDVRSAALSKADFGELSILPGKSAESPLVQFVSGTHEDEIVMPPEDEGERLSAREIAILRAWIDHGAKWPDALAGEDRLKPTTSHWSFQSVASPSPPGGSDGLANSPIDAFILASLKSNGLKMSPEADRIPLIRRLYLDVHGLPPTPTQVRDFVGDTGPDAWSRLVVKVLASPRYGERWAQHWLDAVRYADTHGFEVNTPRVNAWPYRDYVIAAFNDDTPYDRFIFEQLAGDSARADIATGFLVAGPALLNGQIGKDRESRLLARQDELNEVIKAASGAFLGLTVGCARCHNHKFDPILQKDYYSLQAIFAGVRYPPGKGTGPKLLHVAMFSQPGPTMRLYRGNPLSPRETVAPESPAIFSSLGLKANAPEQERRVALAKWIASGDNPLTARVMVNRIWQHHFGAGIVETPSDFGAMGSKPTHPKLLDWLATRFVTQGWSIKKMHRLILLSDTYRQSSRPNTRALTIDAKSRLLWRFPPRRMEAEAIRDSMLAVSGLLDLKMGGPGFSLFKKNTNYVRNYVPKENWGPAEWRRMIYVHKVRMEKGGVFGAFDCPDASLPSPTRSRSTTAIQALNLFNSTFVMQQADRLAKRVAREAGKGVDKQVRRLFLLAFSRPPADMEVDDCAAFVRNHGLRELCRVILNTNEFVFMP